jgi:uncharacterized protein YidB (DUF937 family)
MSFGIEQLFRSVAGADWKSPGGGMSSAEFTAALKERAGADLAFVRGELRELGKDLGLSRGDSRAIFDFLEQNGQVSVDALRDKLLRSAGADKAFNLDEFKGGVDNLLDRATGGHGEDSADGLKFRRDAGADRTIDKDEFEAIAKRAGITDQEVIDKAFEKIAGADGEISREEAQEGLGGTRLSKDDLAKKINELGEAEKKDIKFGKAAGADKAMDEDEFAELAKQAGIEDEDQIKQVFEQVAGADGEISKEEFKAAFGDTKLSSEDFKSKFDELAQSNEECGCNGSEEPSEPEPTEPTGCEEPASEPSGCEEPQSNSCSGSDDVWSHEVNNGQATIRLGDKYTITAKEDGSEVILKNNETGAETKIWGDPHVDVGNNGSNDFDFKKDLTFQLDDGTKISIGTVDAGNGTTLASSLTITNGDNAIQVTGLGGNNDGANNLKVVQSNAGETLDDLTADGSITLFEDGDRWLTAQGDSVTQAIINNAEI